MNWQPTQLGDIALINLQLCLALHPDLERLVPACESRAEAVPELLPPLLAIPSSI